MIAHMAAIMLNSQQPSALGTKGAGPTHAEDGGHNGQSWCGGLRNTSACIVVEDDDGR